MKNNAPSPLLEAQNLSITVNEHQHKKVINTKLVDELSFTLYTGKCLAIVGESGSGKSTIVKALLGLCPPNFNIDGNIIYNKKNLANQPTKHHDWVAIRGRKIALIPQNSLNAFNPLLSIGQQVYETTKRHLSLSNTQVQKLIQESFSAVALPDHQTLLTKYPHELSGGVLQRICIAIAFILKPEIIIADEPTSSIDWLSKKEVLSFFKHAIGIHRQAVLMITHDFADVKEIADNLLILKNGKSIEQGTTTEVLANPHHSYTKSLIGVRDKLDSHFQHMLGSQYGEQG